MNKYTILCIYIYDLQIYDILGTEYINKNKVHACYNMFTGWGITFEF